MSDSDLPKKSSSLPADLPLEKSASGAVAGTPRNSVRLTTVFAGRICQYGKAYECIISDVSMGGAKVKLKNPQDFSKFVAANPAELIFERLSDYKALNAHVAWLKPLEHAVGLEFTDSELRRRIVIKKLMPNRWRIANEQLDQENNDTEKNGDAE